jgi:hypothetical protein
MDRVAVARRCGRPIKEPVMMMTKAKILCGIGVAAVVGVASIIPASAGPMLANASGVKAASMDNVVDVRWRGRRGAGIAAGVAAGALFGAAIANSAYAYGPGYYGYGYAPAYTYGYGPSYGPYGSYAYSYGYPGAYGTYRRQQYYPYSVGIPYSHAW